jgi:hypothetical protein
MMQALKVKGAVFLTGLLAATTAFSCGGGGGGTPEVAAEVFGKKISGEDTEELFAAFLASPKGKEFAEDPEFDKDDLQQTVLTFQIKNLIIDHVAEEQGISVAENDQDKVVKELVSDVNDEEFKNSGFRDVDFIRAQRSARLSKEIAAKRFADAPVSDQAVQDEYELRKSKKLFDSSWKMAVITAIMKTEDLARQVRNRTEQGEPFSDVATELGGVVGPVEVTPLSPFSPKVIEALGALQQGQMTDVIKIALDGFFVGFVEERQDTPELSFEDVKDTLRSILEDAKRQELFEDWFFQRIQKAKVKVDGHYGKWDPKTGNVV